MAARWTRESSRLPTMVGPASLTRLSFGGADVCSDDMGNIPDNNRRSVFDLCWSGSGQVLLYRACRAASIRSCPAFGNCCVTLGCLVDPNSVEPVVKR